ncbi:hypothetical protein ACFY3U_18130 [Micromonospora sp. NPDC000089]|uniref:hypothetical protein n=1 Tax=unclassified Micromonospora TaxID=2617518 RepID=UPI00368348CE
MSAPRFPVLLDGPDNRVDDPRELLLGYLDWYREALARKTAGLSEERLRTPVGGPGWSPLGAAPGLGGTAMDPVGLRRRAGRALPAW